TTPAEITGTRVTTMAMARLRAKETARVKTDRFSTQPVGGLRPSLFFLIPGGTLFQLSGDESTPLRGNPPLSAHPRFRPRSNQHQSHYARNRSGRRQTDRP